MSSDTIISIFNLRKKYRNTGEEALKGIDLSIQAGEFFGLLGPNSAGKTTLISILCGIVGPTSGEVKIFGKDVNHSMNSIKENIGLVPQDIALYPALTVAENILFFGKMHGIYGRELKNKLVKFIEIFNLEEHRNKMISKCSGGIKRRVNLISGLIHEPALLLLDEPTLGVDTQLRAMIFDFLLQLNKSGKTIIYTTHYMKEAELLCSQVNIIDHGKIIAGGKPSELVAASTGCKDLGQLFLNLTGRDLRD